MTDPIKEHPAAALGPVVDLASGYLESLPDRPVRDPLAEKLIAELDGELPEDGVGALPAMRELVRVGAAAATHSSGPRFFHFVTGGVTPAALGADWLTSLLDQNAFAWASSSFATSVENVTHRWLLDLFGLPATWGTAVVSSATMANLTGLAAARQWWGERHGVDVSAAGLAGLPVMPVLSSGYLHPSARKALQLLGCGKDQQVSCVRDDAGRLDLAALERSLRDLDAPAVLVANAGDVNTGDFDPIDAMADLAERYGAWLHVDGAFGLFAALSPTTVHLVQGVERANSVASDGHKWLNVPYDCGFAFLADKSYLTSAFGMPGAPYLPGPDDPHPSYGSLGPDSSRRARALPIWATLRAYGRSGYRAMVERQLAIASHLGRLVTEAPDFELLADVQLCIVCFRYTPAGVPDSELNALNARLGEELLADGRVFAGSTKYRGMSAFRPAIVNWRTTEVEVELLVDVLRELGGRLAVS